MLESTTYKDPQWWKLYRAVGLLSISSSKKSVLTCLLHHRNPKTGQCNPTEKRIAHETKLSLRTVERAIGGLCEDGLLRVFSRFPTNAYSVDVAKLARAGDEFEARCKEYRVHPDRSDGCRPTEVAGHPDRTGGYYPTEVAGNNKKGKEKVENGKGTEKSHGAPPRGGGGSRSYFSPPAGEVQNTGGVLARFERTLKNDPSRISDLYGWYIWLQEQACHPSLNSSDNCAQQARRLESDVYDLLEDADVERLRMEMSDFEPEFEEWYSIYPRKEVKSESRRSYRVARKKVDREALLEGAKRSAKEYAGREKHLIPHPATWLNQERWDDDYRKGQPFPKASDPMSGVRV